ncbi:hypothetical protein LSAT2_015999 [Lamellibrachia satsuma]|nr:hypothetical protein LSAT2_015999 [Lamellibrachia satsuma]
MASKYVIEGTTTHSCRDGTTLLDTWSRGIMRSNDAIRTPYKMNTSTKGVLLFVTIVACCVHGSHSWFEECDGQNYDARMETCCEGILWAGATPYDECCGMRVYDNRKYVCCDGELFSKREREQC